MRSQALALLIGVLPLGAAHGSDLRERFLACGSRPSAERLACYEGVAQTLQPATAAAARPVTPPPAEPDRLRPGERRSSGRWVISAEVDPMNDRTTVIAYMSSSSRPLLPFSQAPGLFVRCRGNVPEAAVIMDKYLGSSGLRVQMRFDQHPPQRAEWPASSNGRGVFATNPRDFVRRLAQSNDLLFEVSDIRGVPFRAEFQTSGLDGFLPLLPCITQQPAPRRNQTAAR